MRYQMKELACVRAKFTFYCIHINVHSRELQWNAAFLENAKFNNYRY